MSMREQASSETFNKVPKLDTKSAVAHYSNLGEPGRENSYVLLALEPELALK